MTPRQRRQRVADAISFAFRDGVWISQLMAARAAHDLDVEWRSWLTAIAERAAALNATAPANSARTFTEWVEAELIRAQAFGELDQRVAAWIDDTPLVEGEPWGGPPERLAMPTEMGELRWQVPKLVTHTDLGEFVNLGPGELDWYADVKSLERSVPDENLRHYNYYWRAKRKGGARLVEAPKQNLKYIQRKILRDILNHIPPHETSHGFRRGRSIQSYASPHTARDVVVRLDLRDFFTTIPAGRVFGIFHAAGYPEPVAHTLTGLTTNAAPAHVLGARPDRSERSDHLEPYLRSPHLPQGAPTSPALANLAAYGLDRRLNALAKRFGAKYTRYADDLAISGDDDFAHTVDRFMYLADAVVRDEGFRLNTKKTSVRRSHQRQVLTGMVVNKQLNVHRHDYDRLKAILYDALHNGPEMANRAGHPHFQAHVEGRISFVQATNPARARRLWAMFDQVGWS